MCGIVGYVGSRPLMPLLVGGNSQGLAPRRVSDKLANLERTLV